MGRGRNKSGQKWRTKVARVAKAVTLRNVETKRLGISLAAGSLTQLTNISSNVTFYKPTDLLLQGVEADDIIGREITLKGVRENYMFTNFGVTTPGAQCVVRIIWLKIDPYLSTGALSASQLFVQGTNANVGTWILRTKNEPSSIIQKVYYDRLFTMPLQQQATQPTQKNVKTNINFHNMRWYRDTNSSVIGSKFDVVRVLLSYSPGNAAGDNNTQYASDARLYYKDT